MEDEIKITELQQELNQSLEELTQSLEKLKKELNLLSNLHSQIEDKYVPDYLALIESQPVEQQAKLVERVYRILNEQGQLLMILTEKYIEKHDGTLVLLAVECSRAQ